MYELPDDLINCYFSSLDIALQVTWVGSQNAPSCDFIDAALIITLMTSEQGGSGQAWPVHREQEKRAPWHLSEVYKMEPASGSSHYTHHNNEGRWYIYYTGLTLIWVTRILEWLERVIYFSMTFSLLRSLLHCALQSPRPPPCPGSWWSTSPQPMAWTCPHSPASLLSRTPASPGWPGRFRRIRTITSMPHSKSKPTLGKTAPSLPVIPPNMTTMTIMTEPVNKKLLTSMIIDYSLTKSWLQALTFPWLFLDQNPCSQQYGKSGTTQILGTGGDFTQTLWPCKGSHTKGVWQTPHLPLTP